MDNKEGPCVFSLFLMATCPHSRSCCVWDKDKRKRQVYVLTSNFSCVYIFLNKARPADDDNRQQDDYWNRSREYQKGEGQTKRHVHAFTQHNCELSWWRTWEWERRARAEKRNFHKYALQWRVKDMLSFSCAYLPRNKIYMEICLVFLFCTVQCSSPFSFFAETHRKEDDNGRRKRKGRGAIYYAQYWKRCHDECHRVLPQILMPSSPSFIYFIFLPPSFS